MISFTFAEVGEVDHQDRELDDVVELAAGRLRDGAQVPEHLVRLRFDALDEIAGRRIEPELPGQVDGIARAHALRIGAERRRRMLRMDRLLASWLDRLRRTTRRIYTCAGRGRQRSTVVPRVDPRVDAAVQRPHALEPELHRSFCATLTALASFGHAQ